MNNLLLANYIKSAWRNVLRHKLFSVINIMGLAIGLAAVMLIALYVRYETSYDNFWKNADSIYQVTTQLNLPGQPSNDMLRVSYPTFKALVREIPEIDKSGSISYTQGVAKINGESFTEQISFADPGIFNVLEFTAVEGTLGGALTAPNTMIITKSFADKYFPDESAIGKTISASALSVAKDYQITAVVADLPKNTNIPLNALIPLEPESWDRFTSFFRSNTESYITLKNGVGIDQVTARFDDIIDRNFPDINLDDPTIAKSDVVKIGAMKLTDLHLHAKGFSIIPTNDFSTIVVFSSVSIVILLIACINFMNLSTARATRRAKEVSLRKLSGASRRQLIHQFIGESFLLSLIALLIAVAIVEVSLPYFNQMVGLELSLEYSGYTIGIMLFLSLIVGFTGGAYPALILSNYRPAMALTANQSTENKSTLIFRTGLVIFQFTATIILFVSTLVILGQMNFTSTKDLGYNPENLITVYGYRTEDLPANLDIILDRFNNIQGVENVTWTGNFYPGSAGDPANFLRAAGDNNPNYQLTIRRSVGYEFFDTYGVPIIAGRPFNRDFNDETASIEEIANGDGHTAGIVINEAAVRQFGFANPEDALNNILYLNLGSYQDIERVEAEYRIIGVTPDIHFRDLKTETSPEFYRIESDAATFITVRFNGDPQNFLDQAKSIWRQEMPENTFDFELSANTLAEQYAQENGEVIMFSTFSGLAIFIACLGLFGLASFTAERRAKEIGIRKVFGAEVWQIVRMLVFQFSKPVLIANIIAWPIAYLAMSRWLESFVYRIDDMVIIALCLLAGLTALLIAWATVAGNSYAVARQNPIKALRYE